MALRDFVIIAHTPTNYVAAGERVRDHIVGIDNILAVASPGGRPGDESIVAPTVVQLAAEGLDDAIAYWTLDFDLESQIPASDSDYDLESNTTPSSSYIPFSVVNAKAALAQPLGAMMCHDATGAWTTAHIPALALDGDMTFLCMGMYFTQSDAVEFTLANYGDIASGTETGATQRMPFRYSLADKPGVGPSDVRDRVLKYAHYTAGDALVSESPDLDAAAQSGNGIGISIPGNIDYCHGFTRSVGATTDVHYYVNALKVAESTGLVNPGVAGTGTPMRLHIGVGHEASNSFNGVIRCFIIFDRVLSAAEILAYYELCIGKR